MDKYIKDMFGNIDSIYDDDNIRDTLHLECSTNATSNSKKFSFYWWDIYCMINSFCNNFMSSPNVWDQSSNIIFDTHVRDDKYDILIIG